MPLERFRPTGPTTTRAASTRTDPADAPPRLPSARPGERPAPGDPLGTTFVLLYNPARMSWPDRGSAIRATRRGAAVRRHWSTGIRRTGIRPGDTALLVRVGLPARGLIGVGTFTSPCLPDPDWSGDGRAPAVAQVALRELVADPDLIPLETLAAEAPWSGWLYLQGSGVRVPPPVAKETLVLWRSWVGSTRAATSPELRKGLSIRD